jgi:selenide,water dikinase
MSKELEYKLTAYSHGAGCGCKISPAILDDILSSSFAAPDNKNLIVGNSSKDDAAVYDLGNGTALISTTDFFMPIVDDAFAFGKIAAANAISDVYAMGGKPILAIAILGWPVDKLPPAVARQVIEGARAICAEAGIPLAGGHSIDNPEPVFGLAVNGIAAIKNIKTNSGAKPGDVLFLTKPLGIGILSTAQKRGFINAADYDVMVKQLVQLNSMGEILGNIEGVHAMTDVTGFGFLGHLTELAEGSGLSALVPFDALPVIEAAKKYLEQGAIPGGTNRNWKSYGHKVQIAENLTHLNPINILADPQTNGGLLIAVDKAFEGAVTQILAASGLFAKPVGVITERSQYAVNIQ